MLQNFGNVEELINAAIIDNIIVPDSKKETIESFYLPDTPSEPARFFRFLTDNVTLESNGMGVSLRENKYNISKLLEAEGFDYGMLKHLIDDFEGRLLSQFYENKDEK